MNREDKIQLGVLAGAALAVPFLVAVASDLPMWLVLGIAVVLLSGVGIRAVQLARQDAVEWPMQQPITAAPPPQPTPPAEFELSGVPLASATLDYRFLFAGRVVWRQLPNSSGWRNVNPSALAAESILERALEVTARHHPADTLIAGHQLAATLGMAARDRSGQVEAWATEVTLGLPAEDEQRLARLAELRKNEQMWEQERAAERSTRAYLVNDALATPGSAMVWWLARNPDQVEEAVRLRDTLARLSAAVRQNEPGAPAPDQPWTFPDTADRVLTVVPAHHGGHDLTADTRSEPALPPAAEPPEGRSVQA